jgi:hypothetical protein
VYLALFGPKDLVIFDHPYNAEYLRASGRPRGRLMARRSSGSGREPEGWSVGPDSRDVDGNAWAGSADASRQLGAVARTGRTTSNSQIGIVGRMVSVGWLRASRRRRPAELAWPGWVRR